MNNEITGIDVLLILLYTGIIMGLGYSYSRRFKYAFLRKYFVQGLALKLLCGFGFGLVYVYYYGGGDTQLYFRGANEIFQNFFNEGKGINAFLEPYFGNYGNASTKLTQRLAGFVNLFAFNSYWSTTLLFAAISFIGLWLIFFSFYRLFPLLHKPLSLAALFIPGVVFWSSGIMKDTICMLFIGVILFYVQNLFLYRKHIIASIFWLVISFQIIITLKAYIALAMLVSIALYAFLALKSKIKNPGTRALVLPLALAIIALGTVASINSIGASLERYSIENIMETAQTYQTYHTRTSTAGRGSEVRTGSAYNLGEINYASPASIISKVPLALNVTFFRPYIWEVKNPVMLLSAIESTLILLFTLKVLRRSGLKKFIKSVFTNKEVLFCFTFALIFGFAVGFTTYNFGSLVRYKAPCIPFYLIALILIQHSHRKQTAVPRSKTPVKRIKPVQLPYAMP